MGVGQTVYREVVPGLSTFSVPFSRFGIIPVGGRSTAIKLRGANGSTSTNGAGSGTVWLLASSPLNALTREKIDAMGKVGWIVAPDNVHSLFLKQYSEAYPEAKVIGVLGLEKKNADVKFAGLYGRDKECTKYGFEDEIAARFFGTFPNRDVAFFHKDSKTMITADLLFNLPAREQFSGHPKGQPYSPIPFLARFSCSFNPFSSLHSFFIKIASAGAPIPDALAPVSGLSKQGGSTLERKKAFAADAAAVAAWDFERIVMCHGDVIEDDPKLGKMTAKQAWLSAFSSVLNPDGSPKF
ncbi:hypothetical protein K437DRAFT_257625 [Tilletiaria anomala UBC 951]|uniref:Uncharacterized protein n=1 Tax=Tilletiaria anomala (strain ATCC 24038 / CBS 436.72 / UBC 951) TaxID=1037660 RepID=A0A066VNN4_TILAU|nr:uncharacterized protein K437DRAFT_257625 [Tilletiaria anomala UBC 951]KDN43101.1 hypothetical protein K437DRAFT_257625 [Tilletiaria anomala UBC 951]